MRIVVSAATAAAVLCAAQLALAQGPPDRQERNRGERAAPQRDPGARGGQERGSPRVEQRERSVPRVQREQRPSAELARGGERRAVESGRDAGADRARRAREGAERRQVERRNVERRQMERRQVERRDAQQRQAEQPDRVRQRSKEDRADRVRERGDERVQQRADRGDRAEHRQAVRDARARLTQEQRTRFYSSFDRRRVTNVSFRARIGTRIPRSVRLYAVPAAVIGIVPAYSYYRYVYVDDTICIVDPDTYEIVDLIEYAPGAPTVVEARLALNDWERNLILDAIGPDFPEAGIELRLALGAEVPGRVELHRFPDVVLDRVPKVRDYRFAVTDSDVVIVDPRDREIELVVRR